MKVLSVEPVPGNSDVLISVKRLFRRREQFVGSGGSFKRVRDGRRANERMERTFRELCADHKARRAIS